jgi:hypothetical protein
VGVDLRPLGPADPPAVALTRLIEDALRQSLERRDRAATEPLDLPTVGGRGLQPGVDLDDSAALLELMERHDAAP